MYVEPATPTPRPYGSRRCLRFQPLARSTSSRHSRKPFEVTLKSFTVRVLAPMKLRLRSSIGSISSRSAIRSSCTSIAKRGCTEPWPRFGPQAGLFV